MIDSDGGIHRFADSAWQTRMAWAATTIWAGAIAFMYAHYHWSDGSLFSKPDVFGSFLQGVFSPVAFLWLVVGYMLQRKELELQRIELKKNNESQVGQMAELSKQAEFLSEQTRLARARSNAEFDFLLGLEEAMSVPGSTPQMRDVRLVIRNLGRTVFSVRLDLESPSPEFKIKMGLRFAHFVEDTTRVLMLGPFQDGVFPAARLHVTFVRADGSGRRSTYIFGENGSVLTPSGTVDVVIGNGWGAISP